MGITNWFSWSDYLETFRVSFYFDDKAEALIESSDLPGIIKDNFKTGKRCGEIRAVSVIMSGLPNVEEVKKLVAIKMKIK